MNNIIFKTPSSSEEFKEYDLFRWEILRKPIGKSIESLKDEYEDSSYHLIGVKVIELLEAEAKKKQINKIILNARNYVVEFYAKSGYKAVRKYESSDTGIPHTTMEKIL